MKYEQVFFFNDTATTEIYTLSLHDALPISGRFPSAVRRARPQHRRSDRTRTSAGRLRPALPHEYEQGGRPAGTRGRLSDRKSTRLNSSHANISYAVFCLKKKNSFYSCSLHS